MLFYFTIYIVQLNKNLVSHLVIIIIAAFVYYYWFPSRTIYYFALFILGFLLRSLKKKSQGVRIFLKNIFSRNVGEKLFLLQNYSYSIFLIHGSFQLLFIQIMNLDLWLSLLLSIITTLIASYCHKKISDTLISKLESIGWRQVDSNGIP